MAHPVGVQKSAGTTVGSCTPGNENFVRAACAAFRSTWLGARRHDVLAMLEYLLLVFSLVGATVRDRDALVAENLLLRHQLAVLTRPTRKRPRLRARNKLFWVVVRALRRGDWRRHLVLVRPESVIRWHHQAWRLFWRLRSRGPLGRPRVSVEVQELIVTMARDNPRWGSERIRGELLKLGLTVSKRSIQRYRPRGRAGPPSQTWRTFLANHAHHLWAADLLPVQTLTFKTLYVLIFIAHGRRELMHVNVTANPTAAWVWRQVIEAMPWGRKPRHLLRDRDAVYGRDFRACAGRIGIDAIATPVASPRANAVAERMIGTLRRECLDHHRRRAASPIGAHRVCPVLQRRATPPDAAPRDARAGAAPGRRLGAVTAGTRGSPSRLRTSCLIADRLLRPHTRTPCRSG